MNADSASRDSLSRDSLSRDSLSRDDADHGEALLRALDDRSVEPDVALWLWIDDEDRWVYTVAGGLFQTEPEAANEQLTAALDELGTPFPFERVVVRPVDDPLLTTLGRKVQVGGVSRVRLGANNVDGTPVAPCLVYRLKLPSEAPPRRVEVRIVDQSPAATEVDPQLVEAARLRREAARAAKSRARAARAETRAAQAKARAAAARSRRAGRARRPDA